MAYIGQPAPTTVSATATTETFTGNGVDTDFTLSKSVTENNPSAIEVFVSNVQQQPTTSFTLSGTTLSFTAAPDSGEPIYVTFRDYTAAPVFTVPDGGVTAGKLATDSVATTNIQAVAVTNAKLATDAVTAAKIQNGAVTGDKLDVGAVTTTKIVDENITSLKLASNLVLRGATVFDAGSLEKANIVSAAVVSNITIDLQLSPIVYFTSETDTSGAKTVNFTSMAGVSVGNVASFALLITNNSTNNAYISTAQVDGAPANVIKWSGGTPTVGSANIDVYAFSVFKTADSTYTVIGSKNEYQ